MGAFAEMSDRDDMRARLVDSEAEAAAIDAMVCVGCGCTTLRACEGGCFWAAGDPASGKGICSNCVGIPIAELDRRVAL